MSEEIEYPSKERERAKVNVKVSAEVNTYLHDLYNQIQYEFCEQYEDEIKDLQKEKDGLNNIINGLEKYCNEEIIDYDKAIDSKILSEIDRDRYEAEKMCFLDMLDKLKALKENK